LRPFPFIHRSAKAAKVQPFRECCGVLPGRGLQSWQVGIANQLCTCISAISVDLLMLVDAGIAIFRFLLFSRIS
jgi:hypothetical protein